MDRIIKTSQLLSLLFIASTAVYGQTDDNELFFSNQTIPVVLSASHLSQPQTEAPASVTIIDHALIKASGATQITDLLRLVPGMQIGNSRGNFPVVAYQGLTSEFPQGVQVVIDGSSVYSPLIGGTMWSTLPIMLEDIERIEVVRGPNSASFGSNAFQGVINITTSHAAQSPGLLTSFSANNNKAERSFLRISNTTENKQLSYRISLASEKKEGYKKIPDDYSKNQFTSRFDLQVGSYDTLQFSLSGIDSKRQTQFPDPTSVFVLFDPKRDRNESSQFAQVTWQHQTNDDQHINTHLSFHHFDGKDKYLESLTHSTIDLTSESTDWNFSFEHTLKLNDENRLVWGAGAIHESVYLPFRLNTQDKKTNTRLRTFGNIESRFGDQFFLNTGALIEVDRLIGTHFSPRITLNYINSKHHSFRLTTTRAFRSPTLSEQYRNTYYFETLIQSSTGDLEPETVQSIEAAYHGTHLNNSLNSDIKFFNNRYKGLINNGLSNSIKILDNVDSARTYGAEFEVNYRPNHHDILHAAYAYTAVNHESDSRLKSSIPKHNFSLLLARQYDDGWHAGLEFYYTSSMQYLGAQNVPQGTFKRFDLSIGRKTRFSQNRSIDIKLDLQLALDKNIDLHKHATADTLLFLEVVYRAE